MVLGADKESISPEVDCGHVSLGVALSVFLEMERVLRSTRRADNKVQLQGWKLQACV